MHSDETNLNYLTVKYCTFSRISTPRTQRNFWYARSRYI